MYRALVALLVACSPLLLAATVWGETGAEKCGFLDGFRALRDQIGAQRVGECLEHSRPVDGGVEQRTTGGLLVWNAVANVVAFTDGGRTWVAGPNGIEVRENGERFGWEEEALRAAEEAEVAALEVTPGQLALAYVETVRGNTELELEHVYAKAYDLAEERLQHWIRDGRDALVELAGSMRARTSRFQGWISGGGG